MHIQEDIKLDFQDVLIRPKRSTLTSRADVNLERTFTFIHSKRTWTGVPIIASNMDSSGTFSIAKALAPNKIITALHKHYTVDELKAFFQEFNNPDYVAYSLGIREEDLQKLREVLDSGLGSCFHFIVLDVPNAYLDRFITHLKTLRALCPDHTIIAGNCVTNEVTEDILLHGADVVKVGIGSGSACITRKQSGVGYPQLSATIECADAAHGINTKNPGCGLIVSDGGFVTPGDVAKGFCAGADFIMTGSLFSGYEESGGETVERDGSLFKEYYGSSSKKAMDKHYGGVAKHRASEGRSLLIPHKGNVQDFIDELFGSLRSCATYIGARSLKEFSRRATFIRVNTQLNRSLIRYEE